MPFWKRSDVVTEAEWNSCTDAQPMLAFLNARRLASDRKLGLFACACARRTWDMLTEPSSHSAIEIAERAADGLASAAEVQAAARAALAVSLIPTVPPSATSNDEIVLVIARGGPQAFAAVAAAAAVDGNAGAVEAAATGAACFASPRDEGAAPAARAIHAAILRDLVGPLPFRAVTLRTEKNGTVVRLAKAIYDDRAFERLPTLANALEDAGCCEEEILSHCRQQGMVHVRGCWVVDLLLNKE
jgi:hypothetical protein